MNIKGENEIKQFEDLILTVKDFAISFVETIHEPFMVLNKDKKVMYANSSFYDYFKVTPDETIGNVIYDIGNRRCDIPKLQMLLDEILKNKKTFKNFEIEHDFQAIGHRIMIVNARIVEVQEKSEHIILTAIADVTDIRKKDNELKERNAQLEKLNAELEKANGELARFNKLFVGRELRMIELKKTIKGHEEKAASLKP